MSPEELISEVRASGTKITVVGDYLELEGPCPLPDELFIKMKELRRKS